MVYRHNKAVTAPWKIVFWSCAQFPDALHTSIVLSKYIKGLEGLMIGLPSIQA